MLLTLQLLSVLADGTDEGMVRSHKAEATGGNLMNLKVHSVV
tara:strand:- start:111 stop:236 length:126 start_codon:yes stop_codon:yes gene_type:complete